MIRSLRSLLALALVASPLLAQDSATTRSRDSVARAISRADSVDTVILDITVDPAANERHTVFLQKGLVYRARFGGPGVTILMRSRRNRQLPFIVTATSMADATGATEYEIYPAADGDIEFTPIATEERVPVRFVLWRDARASLRRRNQVNDGRWRAGPEFAWGLHGSFRHDGEKLRDPGEYIAFCFAFRNGKSILGILHGCAVGVETGYGAGEEQLKLFIQPRLSLLGSSTTRRGRGMDTGIVTHIVVGGGKIDWGLGVYGALDFAPTASGRGFRAVAQVRHDWLNGGFRDGFGFITVEVTRSQVSLGYYW